MVSVNNRIEGVCFIREWPDSDGMLTYWCPACEGGHTITFGGNETWQWDGNADYPTLSPSVLTYPHLRSINEADPDSDAQMKPQLRCHSFVRGGRIEYLADCEHALAGQTIDMVPLPAAYHRFLNP